MNSQYAYIETYGCAANQNNSEILKGILMQSNYQITNNPKIADIIIINSCVVKGKTENKIKRRVQDLSKEYSKKLLIICGCMPETDFKEIKKLAPNSILLGTHHFKDIIKLINNYKNNQLTGEKQVGYLDFNEEEKVLLPKIPKNKLISITQISEGCLGECLYCKARLAKGKLFSYDMDKIVKSVASDLSQGAREVWLTSQDCAAYGMDKYGESKLPELLKQILELRHNFKLRLGMMNPNHLCGFLDEIIEIYKNKKMYKFLHVPIQSASDKVLKDMKRGYSMDKVWEVVSQFRREFVDGVVATDIIVGYPTERDGDHLKNLDFVGRFCPDVFNLSKFSSHRGTKAGKLGVLDIGVVNRRASELMALHRDGALSRKKRFIGRKVKVFVNCKSKMPGFLEGRDENYNIVFVRGSRNIWERVLRLELIGLGCIGCLGWLLLKNILPPFSNILQDPSL